MKIAALIVTLFTVGALTVFLGILRCFRFEQADLEEVCVECGRVDDLLIGGHCGYCRDWFTTVKWIES